AYVINPVELYDKIMNRAWSSAEPGVIFVDKFRNYNLMQNDNNYKIVTGNPCVTGDTNILTDKGHIRIDSLIGSKVNVWNGFEYSEVEPRVTGTNQKILNVELSNGRTLKCTPYHKFILSNGERVEARNLKINDKLVKHKLPVIHGNVELHNAYTQGAFSGDGFINKDRKAKYISLYGIKKSMSNRLSIISQREESHERSTYNIDVMYDKDFVPSNNYTTLSRLDWLAGLLDTDGTADKTGNISISSINKDFLLDIQLMLQTLGCHSTVSVMKKEGIRLLPDGKGENKGYLCKESYRLLISSYCTKALVELGLKCSRIVINTNPNRDASRFIYIKNITEQSELEDKVYCFNEPKNHSGIFNGVITSQCGEQPLPQNGACNLGSINLSEYVINPYSKDSYFDMESFGCDINTYIKALDDVLEEGKEFHALPQQREMAKNYRNIGLGIMGLATMFMKLGIVYGSKESKDITNNIMKNMFEYSLIASNLLAVERGCFPMYNKNILNSDILKNVNPSVLSI
ncbi:MAG: LAGLIDADG family homing endonuclease, partial [Fusobacteriaceae bacterium]